MKRNRIKKVIFSFSFFCIFFSLSACGANSANFQQGPNPNVESDFKSYDDNKTLAKDNQGYSDDLSYIVDDNTYEIDGRGIIWGDIELLKVNASEQDDFQISGTIQINNGNYKIIKINSQNDVTVLLEDEESFDKSIVLEKGMNIIKIVGKPANFNLLDIKIAMPETIKDINSWLPLTEQMHTENTHVLNPTAAVIYELCNQFTVEEIAEKLLENVEDKPDIGEVIDDVNQVIKMLLDEKLLITRE